MGRFNLSEAIVREKAAAYIEEVNRIIGDPERGDCQAIERGLREALRILGGASLGAVLGERAAHMPRPVRCDACGGTLKLVAGDRSRHLYSMVGETTVERAVYVCVDCHHGQNPFDETMGLDQGALTPGLARIACRIGIEDAFENAAAVIQETVGIHVPAGAVRRVCEKVGAVAEAQQHAVIDDAGHVREPRDGVEMLLVEVDGVMAHIDGSWHEVKVGRASSLGPTTHEDTRSKRRILDLGPTTCGGGREEAKDFWYRAYVLALQAGLGQTTHQVVVLGDGARWIWRDAAAFLGGPHRTVIEIVDIFHAYAHLWNVAHALFADDIARAAWIHPLKDALYEQGGGPILAALQALHPTDPQAREIVDTETGYFTTNASRMDYPRYLAQQWPIGSGAIESLCKNLVEKRAKQAGMRWTGAGIDAILALRAVHRSQHWDDFWAHAPLVEHRHRHPHARPLRLLPSTDSAATVIPAVDSAQPLVVSVASSAPASPSPPPTLDRGKGWARGPAVLPKWSQCA